LRVSRLVRPVALPRLVLNRSGAYPRLDAAVLGTWALAGGMVVYLGLDGGGYDILVHSQAGIVVWWILLVGAAWGLLPATRFTRLACTTLALFGGFVAWTALAATWSLSSERSLQDLSLVSFYFGVLLLGISIHRDRERAVGHTLNAVAAAVVVVACLALASRLRPDLFPAAQQTAAFLGGEQRRLNWPLNYWNALAALIALGLPLLLSIASSARSLAVQAAAAAAIPVVVLCGYLTFSRGGAFTAAAALIVLFALSPERIPKLGTALIAAGGGAVLIAGAVHRTAIEQGLANAAARHQGSTLLVSLILVCAGVALAQTGLGLAVRHGTPPPWMVISHVRARRLLAGGVIACVVVALLAGAPSRLAHAWQDFKQSSSPALSKHSIARYESLSGNGRYDVWKVAVNATSGHLLGGSGPGTFQLLWLPRAPYLDYIQNAHSLYFETLSELGVIGLTVLVAFFVVVLGSAARLVTRCRYEQRTRAAGLAAALLAFVMSAGFDWVWQMPVLPVAFLLMAAAVLAPERTSSAAVSAGSRRVARVAAVAVSVACLAAVAVPLATTSALRKSQAAVSSGNPAHALADARAAAGIEPGAASPQLQLALVLELQGDGRDGLAAARGATADEPANWSTWLVASRLEAETGHPVASLADYRRARSLNPRSPLFRQ
jgi:O-antigen ligase